MEISPVLLGLFATLILLGALALVPAGSEKKLRERMNNLGLGPGAAAAAGPGPSIRATLHSERPLLQRLSARMGRNPDIPKAHATGWPVLAMGALVAGTLGFLGVQGVAGTLLATIAAPAAALGGLWMLFRRDAKLYAEKLFVQIPDALGLVLRAVRAGLPVTEAIRTIGREVPSPTAEEFARVAHETTIGMSIETALWRLHARTGVQEYGFLATTIGLQAQTGGNLAETLGNLADLVRRRVAMATKLKAITSEARASAAILVAMPFVVAALMTLVAPDYVSELFFNPRGTSFLIAFAVLMSLGLLTIRFLMKQALQG
jgi:tight adherence protein B